MLQRLQQFDHFALLRRECQKQVAQQEEEESETLEQLFRTFYQSSSMRVSAATGARWFEHILHARGQMDDESYASFGLHAPKKRELFMHKQSRPLSSGQTFSLSLQVHPLLKAVKPLLFRRIQDLDWSRDFDFVQQLQLLDLLRTGLSLHELQNCLNQPDPELDSALANLLERSLQTVTKTLQAQRQLLPNLEVQLLRVACLEKGNLTPQLIHAILLLDRKC
ncbi:hypothetical protein Ciccas_006662 [Cichlidogyrus casuarinus]|uniref:Uncharacterized protein n=1 Tax=Cichlidogyrus casuarinus TaxID=1844966 RepID=A0ABD2Q673_9PLAT